MGYVFAVISSMFFSIYIIPRKFSQLRPVAFSFFMGIGFLISSLLLYIGTYTTGTREPVDATLAWALVAGAIWATGFVSFVRSVDILGLSRSNQWKNLQGPTGVILSLLLLGEYAQTRPVFAVLAGFAIFASAVALTISSSAEDKKTRNAHIYLAVVSGLCFGLVSVINKHITNHGDIYSQQVVWSIAIALSLFVYMVFQHSTKSITSASKKDISLGLTAGLLYLGASLFMLESLRRLPASIAFPIVQLNGIWTIILGIAWFKEIPCRKNYKRIIVGLIFAVVGVVFLSFARR